MTKKADAPAVPQPDNDPARSTVSEPLSRAIGERYLTYALSTIMHRALPDVVETIKWNSPCFMANGKIICVIQAFKKHVNFVFHKAPETPDTDTFLVDIGERSKMKGLKQLTQVSEIPDNERMIAFIRSAAGSN